MDLAPATVKKLSRELQDLQEKPCEGIRIIINESNLADVQAELDGPVSTPYDGGVFRLRLVLTNEYPQLPPKGYFITKIFHPNVSTNGEICVNVLKKDWAPDVGLRHVLMVIRCLLIAPFPESALNEEAGKLLLENYDEYAKHARLLTGIHAQAPKRPTPLTTSGANAGSGSISQTGAATAETAKAEESGSPAKKTKPEQKTVAAGGVSKVKKSLKRL
mmetsp:Transcript_16447/g.35554  ORF Transcript_16447/g.35554 Transcript_16447/m.35554 type:complete len:218 (+) Transcript_16447:201-854(+)|eukprot:CAMPEP_0202892008 /NCGR_PEP_ID=MMETSP1392-20130828/1880_1 /ASSEMBLY_ACC=CAM_ASM_000868 /TAXON_ID=225041 /ORGANISM="Chlamydomonas chlamydogama, Strain SAG 11-48b" /LENGTH=217 /DNA_ID=CAMNT_0049575883 /DNA_START=183 /DNA_END=836 /DNA_ORIENTATION=-